MTTNKLQLFLIYLFLVCCTCFGRFLRPSSGARNYLELQVLSTNITAAAAAAVAAAAAAAILFDNTRSCKCSYILLMMGEGITRNL
jgi:hypothetical protein